MKTPASNVQYLDQNVTQIFNRQTIKNVEFVGMSMLNAKFNGAHLINVNFGNADLTGADFRNAILENVFIDEHSCFDKANFKNATIAGENLIDYRKKLLFESAHVYLGQAEVPLFETEIPDKIQWATKKYNRELEFEWVSRQKIEAVISQARGCSFTFFEDLEVSKLYRTLYMADEEKYEEEKRKLQKLINELYSSVAVIDLGKPPGLGLVTSKEIASDQLLGIYSGAVTPSKPQQGDNYMLKVESGTSFRTHIISAIKKGSILSLINYAPRQHELEKILNDIDFLPNAIPLVANVRTDKSLDSVNILTYLKAKKSIFPGNILLWAYVKHQYAEGHAGSEICFFKDDPKASIIYPADYVKSSQGITYSKIVLAIISNHTLEVEGKILDINQCEQIIAELEKTQLQKLSNILTMREKWYRENKQPKRAICYSQTASYISRYLAKSVDPWVV